MRIVLKYGGSSVATVEKIQKIADYLIELKKEYEIHTWNTKIAVADTEWQPASPRKSQSIERGYPHRRWERRCGMGYGVETGSYLWTESSFGRCGRDYRVL